MTEAQQYKAVPRDIRGSWAAMLENISLRESRGEHFDWNVDSEYRRTKATKSLVMNGVIRQLAQTELRTKFIVGGNLFGIVLMLPNFIETNKIVSLNVTIGRQIELRRLITMSDSLRPDIVHQSIHPMGEIVAATMQQCCELNVET